VEDIGDIILEDLIVEDIGDKKRVEYHGRSLILVIL
jgi:hypothetical protein